LIMCTTWSKSIN